LRIHHFVLCSWAILLTIVCGAFAGENPHGRPGVNPARESRKAYKRMQFFWEQRALPLGFIPPGANARALQQRDEAARQFAASRANAAPSPTDPAWAELGPKPLLTNTVVGEVSGRVTAIAIDPRNNGVIYLGTATGGVWRSTDAGATWTPLTDSQPSMSVGAIAIAPTSDPNAPATIYVGTGEGNFSLDSYYGVGVLKSTDGGATWTNLPGPFATITGWSTPSDTSYASTAHISAIAVKPDDPNTIVVGAQFNSTAQSGIYRSTDGGLSWQQTYAGDAGVEVIFSNYDPNVVFAALGHFGTLTAGVYRSLNGGATWTRLPGNGSNSLMKAAYVGRIALAVTLNTPYATTTMWAGLEDYSSGNLLSLYKSVDGGTNWIRQLTAPNYCGPQCWYDNVIAISPADPNVVYLGGSASAGLYRTTTGGGTWTAINASTSGTVHVDHHALKFTPDGTTLYDGNDGGIWSTTQPGSTVNWTDLNHTLNTLQFYPGMSVSQSNVNLAYAGAQDNGTNKLANGSWTNMTCGDGGFTAADPGSSLTIYASCQAISVRKSIDGGVTFNAIDSTMVSANDRVQFIAPLKMDAARPQTLYFGTYRLWQTQNGGTTWAAVSPDLTASTDRVISAISIAPTDSNTVYVGTSNGRIVSTANILGGAPQWSDTGRGLPTRYVSSIAVDPINPATVFATYSSFTYGLDTLGHVFESVDHGVTWVDISGDLPNTPTNDIILDPDNAGTFYVGTDVGVFRTVNGGVNWLPYGRGLPNVPVTSLVLHRGTRTLVAATHGRGVWEISAPAATVSIAPAQLNFGAVVVGTSSAAQTLTVRNPLQSPVSIGSVQSPPDFAIASSCPSVLYPNSTCSLQVTFRPAVTGTRDGVLTVAVTDPLLNLSVTLTGSGAAPIPPKLVVSPVFLTFDSTAVGTVSSSKRVTIQNAGAGVLNFSSISTTASAFTLAKDCGASLAPNANCSLTLWFRPATTGAVAGAITIASNDAGSPQIVALNGSAVPGADVRHGPRRPRGTQEPAPAISLVETAPLAPNPTEPHATAPTLTPTSASPTVAADSANLGGREPDAGPPFAANREGPRAREVVGPAEHLPLMVAEGRDAEMPRAVSGSIPAAGVDTGSTMAETPGANRQPAPVMAATAPVREAKQRLPGSSRPRKKRKVRILRPHLANQHSEHDGGHSDDGKRHQQQQQEE
jgi:hypothetical protein